MLAGFRRGSEGRPITVGLIVTAMRQAAQVGRDRRAGRAPPRRRAWSASTSPAPEAGYPPDQPPRRLQPHRSTRTSTSRSTPARRSGCRRSGRRCSGAAPSGWAMASASWTTSRCGRTAGVTLGRLAVLRARSARAARDVPDLQRAHRRRRLHRGAPDRPAAPPALPGHGQHRQPADERHLDEQRVRDAAPGVRHRPRRHGVADAQRHEVGVLAVRRAAADHQRADQARLRRRCARRRPPRTWPPPEALSGSGRHRLQEWRDRPLERCRLRGRQGPQRRAHVLAAPPPRAARARALRPR